MSHPEVEVTRQDAEQRFEARFRGDVVGAAYWQESDGRVVFTHTEVDDAVGGQGVGSALARAALDDARTRGLRVVAQCPFIAGWIDRHPDYQDLLG